MIVSKKTTKATDTKTETKAEAKTVETRAVEATVAVSREVVEMAVKAGNEAAAKGYEQTVSATREQAEAVTKAGTQAFKEYEGVFAFHKDNFNAFVEASDIWMNGVQNLNAAWGKFSSKSVEQGVSSTRALMKCSTVEDVITLNSEAARISCDAVVVETQRIREMSIKLAETSVRPLASRVNETVAQFSKRAA